MARWIAAAELPGLIPPAATVYVQTGASEPLALVEALAAAPEASAGVHYVVPVVPGVNRTDYSALHETASMTCFFAPRELHGAIAAGKARLLPLHYAEAYDYLCRRRDYDVALIQLGPPDADGACSLGVTGAFEPDVLARARIVIAAINPRLPRSPGAPRLALEDIDYAMEAERPLLEMAAAAPSPALAALARNVATLIEDGCTIETGIGTAPSAILHALTGRRDLGIHSGLITDAVADLVEAGAVTGARKSIDRGRVVTGLAIGSERLYRFLDAGAAVDFRPVSYTHGPEVLRRIERFRAVNTVIEVDLFGQANAETIGGRQISGIGGLADFVHAARRAPGGRAILALVSTAAAGTVSRIVPALAAGAVVSLPRAEADYVVTEHGVAHLRDRSTDERAEALIAIAAPAFRDDLAAAWEKLRPGGAP